MGKEEVRVSCLYGYQISNWISNFMFSRWNSVEAKKLEPGLWEQDVLMEKGLSNLANMTVGVKNTGDSKP